MNDSVVGAVLIALTAADTILVIDTALTCLGVELDSVVGAAD